MKLTISQKWDIIEWFIKKTPSTCPYTDIFGDWLFDFVDTNETYETCVVNNHDFVYDWAKSQDRTTKKEREQMKISFQFFWSDEDYFDYPTKSKRKKMINSDGDEVYVWFH